MRKRYENHDWPEVTRPNGELNETEIEEICQAYSVGCKGEILIGMRGEHRVITMLLPARAGGDTSEQKSSLLYTKMRQIGCDRCIWIRCKIGRC